MSTMSAIMHLEAWESGKPLLALKFESLQKPEVESKKLRPVGLKEGLILESSLMIPYVAEVLKPAWHWTEEACGEMFDEWVEKLKGTKYKPMDKKVDPDMVRPEF